MLCSIIEMSQGMNHYLSGDLRDHWFYLFTFISLQKFLGEKLLADKDAHKSVFQNVLSGSAQFYVDKILKQHEKWFKDGLKKDW